MIGDQFVLSDENYQSVYKKTNVQCFGIGKFRKIVYIVCTTVDKRNCNLYQYSKLYNIQCTLYASNIGKINCHID